MPELLDEIISVRRSIGDPIANDFHFVNELPAAALKGATYTTGDGVYQHHNGIEWKTYSLKFSDNYIRGLVETKGRLKASIRLIDQLIARIDPAEYITSANAGAQSTGFPSLSEVMAYYNGLRDRLLAEDAEENGMNSGLMLSTERRPVGGVLEGTDAWA